MNFYNVFTLVAVFVWFCFERVLAWPYVRCNRLTIKETPIKSFSTNHPVMDKPGSWFLLAKCLENTCRRVTF